MSAKKWHVGCLLLQKPGLRRRSYSAIIKAIFYLGRCPILQGEFFAKPAESLKQRHDDSSARTQLSQAMNRVWFASALQEAATHSSARESGS